MLADTLPFRLAFWLGRLARLDAIPTLPDHGSPATPAAAPTALRPAFDLETRLMLRDRSWNP